MWYYIYIFFTGKETIVLYFFVRNVGFFNGGYYMMLQYRMSLICENTEPNSVLRC